MDGSLSSVLQADPGAAGEIAAAIALQAVVASHVVDALKLLIKKIPGFADRTLAPWAAQALCAVLSVLLAVRTLLPNDYAWDTWVLGIVIALAAGPLYHDVRSSAQKKVQNGQTPFGG